MSHPGRAEVNCSGCNYPSTNSTNKLKCGHLLCEACFKNSDNVKDKKCPECQARLETGKIYNKDSVSSTPNNPNLQTSELSANQKKVNKTLGDAQNYFENEQYNQALGVLATMKMTLDVNEEVKFDIMKAKCLFRSGMLKDAEKVCDNLCSILNSNHDTAQLQIISHQCYQGLIKLIELSIETIKPDTALTMASISFKVIQSCYEGELKLSKLERVGFWMFNLANALSIQRKKTKITSMLPLMDSISEEMQNTKTDDVKDRFRFMSWFIRYHGRCCNLAGDYDKSVTIHETAIGFMRMTFGEEACKSKVFSFIHNNLGLAYENVNKLEKAEESYTKAIDLLQTPSDWVSKDEESRKMIIFTNNRQRVIDKIKKKIKQWA